MDTIGNLNAQNEKLATDYRKVYATLEQTTNRIERMEYDMVFCRAPSTQTAGQTIAANTERLAARNSGSCAQPKPPAAPAQTVTGLQLRQGTSHTVMGKNTETPTATLQNMRQAVNTNQRSHDNMTKDCMDNALGEWARSKQQSRPKLIWAQVTKLNLRDSTNILPLYLNEKYKIHANYSHKGTIDKYLNQSTSQFILKIYNADRSERSAKLYESACPARSF